MRANEEYKIKQEQKINTLKMHNGFILQWQWPQFYCIPIQQTAFTLVYIMLKNLILFAIIDTCIGVQYFAQRQLHMWTEGTLDQTINLWISRLPTLLIHRLLWRTSWELNQEPQIFNLKTSSDLYQIEDWGGRTSWIILFYECFGGQTGSKQYWAGCFKIK